MIFGRVAMGEAEGAVLAHTQRLPGRVLKKGSVLDAGAVEALRSAGFASVIAARLEPGDVPEDEAAGRLADALLAPGLQRSGAGTGRVNLAAKEPGLLRVDAAAIEAINAVHEAMTVGTLPDYAVVAPREMVATIKVIPFAVPGRVVEQAVAAAGPALSLHPFRPLRVGLVMSTLPGLKPSILQGTEEATAARVTALTGTLLPSVQCAHDEEAIAEALGRLLERGPDILLVAGASAVVDRRDVGPAGIVRAGGEIVHFGMPVDPGNLICLGRIGQRPALVLPGCARSPKLNGIDWVLARLFADLPLGAAEIGRMGVGGLLKDVTARPLPRAKATAPAPAEPPARGKRVAAVVLAAGRSSRMAPYNKLLVPDRTGKPMIARVVDNLLSSAARPVIVVLGHREAELREALGRRPVRLVTAPDYASGLSASLRAGIEAVPADAAAAIVCLGDMPLVTGRMIDRLIETYDADEGRTVVAPTAKGHLGNPVLWDRRFFADITSLTGDSGARKLLDRHSEQLATVELGDAVIRDFDTVESLGTLPEHLRPALQPS
ncbi:MAG: molybdopterin-binding/glycosyltransferase family 2 protein [Acetobacteraceae bacterium]|nr:molybdopterin-binding/glycosyltransferase family 2 protein [Acetobacteraceae bacterium]